MDSVLKSIESYGLSVVLLLGCLYALWRFFWFSIHDVKRTFEQRHETMSQKMDEVRKELSGVKEQIGTLVEMFKVKN